MASDPVEECSAGLLVAPSDSIEVARVLVSVVASVGELSVLLEVDSEDHQWFFLKQLQSSRCQLQRKRARF